MEELTRDLRHALAEAMAEQGAIWTSLHDYAAGRAVGPFVAQMIATERNLAQARNAAEAANRAAEIHRAARAELADHIERLFGAEERPSMAIRALLNRARGLGDAPLLAILDAARAAVIEQSTKAYADLMSAVAAWEGHNGNTD